MLMINFKGQRTIGKANKGINVEKNNRFRKLKTEKRKIKKGIFHRKAKAQHRARGL